MPLQIVRNDITKMKVDAIVNAANESLLGGGGVDGCIHRAAGPQLLAECRTLGGCTTGSAKITGAGKLPCKYVIHAVGPRWIDGRHGEQDNLTSCYRTSLALAKEHHCETIAFPLISSGIYGYPKDEALHVATGTIAEFLQKNDMTVFLVIFDRKAYQIGSKLFADIAEYIDDRYAETHSDAASGRRFEEDLPLTSDNALRGSKPTASVMPNASAMSMPSPIHIEEVAPPKSAISRETLEPSKSLKPLVPSMQPSASKADVHKSHALFRKKKAATLDEALKQIDESFSEMLLRKIDESGMTDAQCYKKANIDRKLFSKIRSDRLYKPSKPTVIAFAIALELPLTEMKDMLMKAGFALSHSSKFDIIIEYFVENGNYNIFEINEALFAFDQSLLG